MIARPAATTPDDNAGHMTRTLLATLVLGLLATAAPLTLHVNAEITTSDAPADPALAVLDKFGFFGRWAIDCARPPSLENIWRQAARPVHGPVRFIESLGEKYLPNDYVVTSATSNGPDSVTIVIRLNDEFDQSLTIVRKDSRVRTMVNRPAGSAAPVVKDGVIVANGRPTPWLTQCDASL